MRRREFIAKTIAVGAAAVVAPMILTESYASTVTLGDMTPTPGTIVQDGMVGKNFSKFTIFFKDKWEQNTVLVGYNGIPVHICSDPVQDENGMWRYEARIMTGDPDLGIPVDRLHNPEPVKNYSIVEQTLELRGNSLT